jgi:hypothetical protein
MRERLNDICVVGTDIYEEEQSSSEETSTVTPEHSMASVPAAATSSSNVPSLANEVQRDSYNFPWPPSLPLELALEPGKEEEVLNRYNMTDEQLTVLLASNAFKVAYQNARKMVSEEGMSFKMKARVLAEQHLTTMDDLICAPTTSASTKGALIDKLVKWADLEPQNKKDSSGNSQAVNIQINL